MALQLKQNFNQGDVISAGLVSETFGLKTIVRQNASNLLNPDKRIMITLINPDGSGEKFTCSEALSASLRGKEISVGTLFNCEIYETLNKFGKSYFTIGFPKGEEQHLDTTFEKLNTTDAVPAPKAVDVKKAAQVLAY